MFSFNSVQVGMSTVTGRHQFPARNKFDIFPFGTCFTDPKV